jgi:CubicO group peptidase (beta-lactamase class C family)
VPSQASFIALAGPAGVSPPPPPPPPVTSNLNIASAADYARNTNGRAMVVWRDGQMIFEQYANGGAAARSELLASGSKSFSCALAAAAMQDGILDVDALAATRISPWAPGGAAPENTQKQMIRLRDLLDLSSGLSGNGAAGSGIYTIDSYAQAVYDRSRYAPDANLVYTPNHFQAFLAYFEIATGGSAQADGGVVGGRDPGEYIQTTVLDRIGARITEWRRDAEGNPILAGGANMTASDWAKYGQFVLQRGQWNGQQVLPPSSMDACRTPQSPQAANVYGRGFWLNVPAINFDPVEDSIPINSEQQQRLAVGGNLIPTAPSDMFFAWGAGNMKLFIVPSRSLVVARIAGATDDIEFFRLLFSAP